MKYNKGMALIEVIILVAILMISSIVILGEYRNYVNGLTPQEIFEIPIGAECTIGKQEVMVVSKNPYEANIYGVLTSSGEVEDVNALALKCDKSEGNYQ